MGSKTEASVRHDSNVMGLVYQERPPRARRTSTSDLVEYDPTTGSERFGSRFFGVNATDGAVMTSGVRPGAGKFASTVPERRLRAAGGRGFPIGSAPNPRPTVAEPGAPSISAAPSQALRQCLAATKRRHRLRHGSLVAVRLHLRGDPVEIHVVERPDSGLRPIDHFRFSQDGLQMDFDSRFRDVAQTGDDLVGIARHEA